MTAAVLMIAAAFALSLGVAHLAQRVFGTERMERLRVVGLVCLGLIVVAMILQR
jgi:hypothetical protein